MPDLILTGDVALKKLQRMAYEIVERNGNEEDLILAGIKQNGLTIAHLILDFLKPLFKGNITVLGIDINKRNPKEISLDFLSGNEIKSFDDKVVIIMDDVANSGKTLLYACKPFLEYYPKKIQTLVLVERSYKEYPVSPDYTGLSLATALSEKIIVETNDLEIIGAHLEV